MTALNFGECPKCGEDSPSVQYRSNGASMNCADFHAGQGEHFHLKCSRCEYPWSMKVNDVGKLVRMRREV